MNPIVLAIAILSVPPTLGPIQVLPAVGPSSGGQLVSISGTFSSDPTRVSFGTANAISFTLTGSNQVIAAAPRGPNASTPGVTASCDVSVWSPSGTSSVSASDRYTWNTTADTPSAIYYSPGSGTLAPGPRSAYLTAITSATSSITLSTWQLSDGTVAAALAYAASTGKTVNLVEDLNNRSGGEPAFAQAIASAGGNVYNAPVPRTIQNNFLTTDETMTVQGNYYLSPTAVQIGSYAAVTSGTNTAYASSLQYGALILTGSALPP